MNKHILSALGCFVAFGLLLAYQTGYFNNGDETSVEIETELFKQVLLFEDEDTYDVSIHLVFPFGEAHNPYAEGLAHYVEHLAWLSAFHTEDNPAEARHSNAWTNSFATGYWLRADTEDLAANIARLVNVALPISLDPQFAREERDIVLREYDFRVKENAYYALNENASRALYSGGALSKSVIGTPEGIAEFSLEDALALHARSHRLQDATLVVYGNIDKRALAEVLSDLVVAPPRSSNSLPPQTMVAFAEGRDEARFPVSAGQEPMYLFRKLIELPEGCANDLACLRMVWMVDNALDSTLPGGIAVPLRFDNFITRSFAFDTYRTDGRYGELYFSAHPDVGVSLDEVGHAFEAALTDSLQAGVPFDSFVKVRNAVIDDLTDIDDPVGHDFTAAIQALQVGAPIHSAKEHLEAVRKIEFAEFNAFLKTLAAPGRVVIRYAEPE